MLKRGRNVFPRVQGQQPKNHVSLPVDAPSSLSPPPHLPPAALTDVTSPWRVDRRQQHVLEVFPCELVTRLHSFPSRRNKSNCSLSLRSDLGKSPRALHSAARKMKLNNYLTLKHGIDGDFPAEGTQGHYSVREGTRQGHYSVREGTRQGCYCVREGTRQ